jgi:hypothetical protein
MKPQDAISAIFLLILVYLVVVNWKGANALVTSGARASIGLVKALQGR